MLRHHRKRQGMTQRQLADLSEISLRAIRDLESGRVTHPRRATTEMLGSALRIQGQSLAQFLGLALDTREEHPDRRLPGMPPPAALTSLIGRDAEAAFVLERLRTDQRLVTLTGIPGVGKTRLALEIARHHFESNDTVVWWVPSPDAVPGGHSDAGTPAGAGGISHLDPQEIQATLGGRRSLLVLDGTEGTGPNVRWLLDVLAVCPSLSVLSTNRTPLSVPGEWVVPVSPLAVPEPAGHERDSLMRVDSVRLLIEQIKRHRPARDLPLSELETIAGICRALDGHPQAIEQAGLSCMVESLDDILHRVTDDPLSLPMAGPQRDSSTTLRRVLTRSLSALDPSSLSVLRQLSGLDGEWELPEASRRLGQATESFVAQVRTLVQLGWLRSTTQALPRFRTLRLVDPLLA
nr:helix-turn-helix domain-containing protein [Kineosporia mesophila]